MSPRTTTSTESSVALPATRERRSDRELAERVARQQAALLEIMRGTALSMELPQIFEMLTEVTVRTLSVGRASIWRFNADESALQLADLFESPAARHSSGIALPASHYPSYFEALKVNRVINAAEARVDARTVEFKDGYLVPLGIVSMLDAAIWYDGKSQGVVCIESVNEARDWFPDEQQFAGSIADLAVLAIENESKRTAQRELERSEQRFAQLFRLSPDWLLVARLSDGKMIEVNDTFQAQSGYLAADIIGKSSLEFGLWVDPQRRAAWFANARGRDDIATTEAEFRLKSGVVRTFQISSQRIEIDGEACLISISRDITESKRQERMLFEIAQGVAAASGESFFSSLVERMLHALEADVALVGSISEKGDAVECIAVHARDGLAATFSYPLLGSPCQEVLEQGVQLFERDVSKVFASHDVISKMGIEGYIGAPLLDSQSKPLGLIAALFRRPIERSDVAQQLIRIFATRASVELERQQQTVEIEYRASHDMLTRLANRFTLDKRIDSSIADRTVGAHGALLVLDLDRFKEVNDTLGHAAGDALLAKTAERLRATYAMDGLHPGTVARMGGDEFAIWLSNIEAPHMADLAASRTLAAIMEPFEIDGFRLELGASVGIALYPAHGDNASDLMRCADIAMYVAKRKGSGFARYEANADPYSARRLTLMSELGEAVRGGQLELHYQPRMNLKSGAPSGFEALVRWRHPTRGLIPPGQFVPLAELTDVIRPLTLWVLDAALAQVAIWNRAGHDVTVSVNLSARHLIDESCPHQVRRLLEKHAVSPERLELEITESALIVDPERATATLRHVHDMGVKISVDDFGTGYSSLSHLRRLPLHALKIDVSFVTHMLTNEADAVIVESTIGLAHNLGLTVVAEGIEDHETLKRLSELGCDEGQGYVIAKPLPESQATAWLNARVV